MKSNTTPADSAPLTSDREDLTGRTFVSRRHANKVVWTVEYYHRNGDWLCRESANGTTMHFHESEIKEWSASPEGVACVPAETCADCGRPYSAGFHMPGEPCVAPSPAEPVKVLGGEPLEAMPSPTSVGLDSSSADAPPLDDISCPSCGVVLAEFQESCDACGSTARAMDGQQLPEGWTLSWFPSTIEICDASGKLVHGHPIPYDAISEADLKAQAIRFALDPCLRSTASKIHAENGLQLHYKTVIHPSGGEWKPVSAPIQRFGMRPGEVCNRLGCKGEMEHQGGLGFACPVCGIAVGIDSQDEDHSQAIPVTPSPVDECLIGDIKTWKRALESGIDGLLPASPDVRKTLPKIKCLEQVIDYMEACDSENEELALILKRHGATEGEMLTAFLERQASSHAAHLAKIQALTEATKDLSQIIAHIMHGGDAYLKDAKYREAINYGMDAARAALALPSPLEAPSES